MREKTLVLEGKILTSLQNIKQKLQNLGFSSISLQENLLILEKVESRDLKNNILHFYKLSFSPNSLTLTYSEGTLDRDLEIFLVFLNVLKICEEDFDLKFLPLLSEMLKLLERLKNYSNKEKMYSFSQEQELREKLSILEKKYRDLVISSEQNALLLIECEKKKEEYLKRIKELENLNDSELKQEIIEWLKIHNGEIDINEFSKVFSVPQKRVEEALNDLLREGYIARV